MRVLLTGATGFVGAHMQKEMLCIPLADETGSVDLRNLRQIRRMVASLQFDAVLHLAAQSFVPESFKQPRQTFEINFLGTLNLLTALRDVGFNGSFLYVGSGDVYGLVHPERLPILEDCPLRPRNPYAVSKVAGEALCYQWSQTESLEIVMVRPFNHIGPGQRDHFAVSNFARQVAEIKKGLREPVVYVGDIDVTRDFTDVRDVVRAYRLLLESRQNGQVYNVCSGIERSIHSLLIKLIEVAGVNARIEQNPNRLRPVEQRRVCGSFEKLFQDTGWKPEISIYQSLEDIFHYWENMLS